MVTTYTSPSYLQLRRRPLRFKVISMGDECVGKSCLIKRFCENCWVPSRIPTVGVDFGSKRVLVGSGAAQQCLHLDFFDLAGAQDYVAVREEVYSDAQGAVLVYDTSKPKTFNSLGLWLAEAAEKRATGMFTVLVANKRQGANQVDPEEARNFATRHGFGFAEVDLPSGSGVEEVFDSIIDALLKRFTGVGQSSLCTAEHIRSPQQDQSPAVNAEV